MNEPVYPVKRGEASTHFYYGDEYRKTKRSFKRFKKYLENLCETNCEDCKYSSHNSKGCEIQNYFDPMLNLIGSEVKK